MSDAEAATWHGRTLRFASSEATSGEDTCRQPEYRYRRVAGDSLMELGFGVTRAGFGSADSVPPRLGLTEVSCGRAAWTAMGGMLLWMGETRAYTVWDGVFFELRRE